METALHVRSSKLWKLKLQNNLCVDRATSGPKQLSAKMPRADAMTGRQMTAGPKIKVSV